MKFLDRIDAIVRPIAVPNLTVILIIGQAALFLMQLSDPAISLKAALVWTQVFDGEVWRVITYLFVPPGMGIFAIFYFWIFYMIGTAMEQSWGTVRYCAYLYTGILLTLLGGLLTPSLPVTGLFLEASVFLAFATLFPNYEFLLFFVLPVKVKYLAMLQFAIYLITLAFGDAVGRISSTAAIGNYLLYFAPTLWEAIRRSRRRIEHQSRTKAAAAAANRPRHICAVCGIDNRTHPSMDFRYCSKCDGELAYCETHLRDHDHVRGK